MKKAILIALASMAMLSACKKVCQKENYGVVTFRNISGQNLKIKVNNTIPQGCLSENNGNLATGGECDAELTANIVHDITVYTDSNTVYWEFTFSVGPCGDRVIEIQ